MRKISENHAEYLNKRFIKTKHKRLKVNINALLQSILKIQ